MSSADLRSTTADAKAVDVLRETLSHEVLEADGTVREVTFLDNIHAAIQSVFAHAPVKCDELAVLRAALTSAILEFAYRGELKFDNVIYKDWSALRNRVRVLAKDSLPKACATSAIAGGSGGRDDSDHDQSTASQETPASDVGKRLLAAVRAGLGTTPTPQVKNDAVQQPAQPLDMWLQTNSEGLAAFIGQIAWSRPPRRHKVYTDRVEAMLDRASHC
jgi:hypothetical protein